MFTAFGTSKYFWCAEKQAALCQPILEANASRPWMGRCPSRQYALSRAYCRPFAALSRKSMFLLGKRMCHIYIYRHIKCPGWHMSFADLSPAFRGLQFPFRKMFVLTCHLNSFTGNNGRPSHTQTIRNPPAESTMRHLGRAGMAPGWTGRHIQ